MDIVKGQLDLLLGKVTEVVDPIGSCTKDAKCILEVFEKLSNDENSSITIMWPENYEEKRNLLCDNTGSVEIRLPIKYKPNLLSGTKLLVVNTVYNLMQAITIQIIPFVGRHFVCQLQGNAAGNLLFLMTELVALASTTGLTAETRQSNKEDMLNEYKDRMETIMKQILRNSRVEIRVTSSGSGSAFVVVLSRGVSPLRL